MVDRGIAIGIVLLMIFLRTNVYTLTYHASCFNEIQADGISQYKHDIMEPHGQARASAKVDKNTECYTNVLFGL